MHAIKGGWVGQTFALAKCNDSGGKKSRIRRSKEERKAMVESFIKKYQKLNNGNFPSLNLTHKEVGGSFYTVREIVREVIQENRVLGPAKFTSEEQSFDMLLEQNPLGTISVEPETSFSSSDGSRILPSHNQGTNKEMGLNSNGWCLESEHQTFEKGQLINGSRQAIEKNEDNYKAVYTESRAGESLELEEHVTELKASTSKVTYVAAGIMVETFPLTSGSGTTYGLDEKPRESIELTETLVEFETENVKREAGIKSSVVNGMNNLESSSVFGNGKVEADLAGPLANDCGLQDEKAVRNPEAPLLEMSNDSTTKEGTTLDTNNFNNPEMKDASPDGIKEAIDAMDSIHTQGVNNSVVSSSTEQSISLKALSASEGNTNTQHDDGSSEGSKPTLDRMHLESREKTSEAPAKPETIPLFAFIKSFFAAFAKFWSD